VVLGPFGRLIKDFGALGYGRVKEGKDRFPVRSGKGDVRLAESIPGSPRADPERRPALAEAHGVGRVHKQMDTNL